MILPTTIQKKQESMTSTVQYKPFDIQNYEIFAAVFLVDNTMDKRVLNNSIVQCADKISNASNQP